MYTVIQSKNIELPDDIADEFMGQRVEFCRTNEGILLRAMDDPIKRFRGMLKGSDITIDNYLREKHSGVTLEA